MSEYLGAIADCQRVKGKYRITVIDVSGGCHTLWHEQDYSLQISSADIYEIHSEVHTRSKAGRVNTYNTLEYVKHFCTKSDKLYDNEVLESRMKAWFFERIGNHSPWSRFDAVERGFKAHEEHPQTIAGRQTTRVINRIHSVKASTEAMYHDEPGTLYQKTEGDWNLLPPNTDTDLFAKAIDDNAPAYGTKSKHLVVRDMQESYATTNSYLGCDETLTVNNFPEIGVSAQVDSIHCQVAIREKHSYEWAMYWAIVAYMKHSHRFPVCKYSDLKEFMWTGLDTYRKRGFKECLWSMRRLGMIEIHGAKSQADIGYDKKCKITVLSQQVYVRKMEVRYNSKTIRTSNSLKMHKFNPKGDEGRGSWQEVYPKGEDGFDLSRGSAAHVYSSWRPYFDIIFARTAKIDLGFSTLLSAHPQQLKAFMYEVVTSATKGYPLCRARWRYNLLLSKKTQRTYEKMNTYLEKRYTHMEIPPDMYRRMSYIAQKTMDKAFTNKFKIASDGTILRQEGNGLRSRRIKWVKPRARLKCSRLRLSQNAIRAWKFAKPYYHEDGKKLVNPHFRTCAKSVVEKRQPITYAETKAQMVKGSGAFAYWKDGVIVPSTNPKDWDTFEPLMKYNQATGDGILPAVPTFSRGARKKVQTSHLRSLTDNSGKDKASFDSPDASRYS